MGRVAQWRLEQVAGGGRAGVHLGELTGDGTSSCVGADGGWAGGRLGELAGGGAGAKSGGGAARSLEKCRPPLRPTEQRRQER